MSNYNFVKSDKGASVIKGILIIIIIGLLCYLGYKGYHILNDLGIIGDDDYNPIDIGTSANVNNQVEKNVSNKEQNVEAIKPLLDSDYGLPEVSSSVRHYYYEQLDDNAKIIYKGLENNINNMKSGNYKIEFGRQFNDLLKTDGGEEKLNMSFQSAWNAFSYDYVDVFYIDVTKLIMVTQTLSLGSLSSHKVELSSGSNPNYYGEGIVSYDDLKSRVKLVSDTRNKIIEQLQGYSQYEQIMYLHDWMINNFEYAATETQADVHNIYGAFTNKKIVCEGYARTFKYILDGLGIDCVLISGSATNSNEETESHAWDYVKLDGKWYAIDVTWDDPIIANKGSLSDEIKRKYFLKGSNDFFYNHKENGYISENSMEFKFPTIERESYK